MSRALLQQAWAMYDRERYDDALRCLADARRDPAWLGDAAYLASLCLTRQGKYDPARFAAREAMAQDPNRPEYHHAYGFSYFMQATENRSVGGLLFNNEHVHAMPLRTAELAYIEALRLAPDDPFYHRMSGWVLYHQGRNADAERAVRRSLALHPESSESLSLLADILKDQRRFKESREAALRALQVDAGDSDGHASLGWSKLHTGDARSALADFREALRLDPDDDNARYGLIEALKARHFFYRWPYGVLSWVESLTDRTVLWYVLSVGAWFMTPVVLLALVLLWVDEPGPAEILGATLGGLVVGIPVMLLVIFTPILSVAVRTMCNALLLLHPLGRHALTPWQRYRAVALAGYLLPIPMAVVGALVFFIAVKLLGVESLGEHPAVTRVFIRTFSLLLLAGPLAGWAGALGTRRAWPGAIVGGGALLVWGVTWFLPGVSGAIAAGPLPWLYLFLGTVWGYLLVRSI